MAGNKLNCTNKRKKLLQNTLLANSGHFMGVISKTSNYVPPPPNHGDLNRSKIEFDFKYK